MDEKTQSSQNENLGQKQKQTPPTSPKEILGDYLLEREFRLNQSAHELISKHKLKKD